MTLTGGTFLKKSSPYFLLTSIFILTFICLYYFRHADDNRLTSWLWAFEGIGVGRAVVVVFMALAASFVLSRFPSPGPKALFCISFVSTSFFWSVPEVIIDASRYFTAAKHLELYGTGYFINEWGRQIQAWTDLPLMSFIYGLVFRYAGESRLYIQILNSVLFSLTVVLTALTGRELFKEDNWSRELSGLLLLGMPFLFSQTPLMLVDVGCMFFLMLSVYTFIRTLRGGRGYMLFAAVSIALSVFVKYSLWPMLSVLAVIFAVEYFIGSAPKRITFKRGASVFFLASVLSGAFIIYRFDYFSEQIRLLVSYQAPGLRRWSESYVSTFLFQVHPLITASAIFSIYDAFARKDYRYVVALWLPLLMFVFRIERIRYVMPVFPMVALMASYGIRGIRPEGVRRFLATSAALVSFAVALFAYKPLLEGMSMGALISAGESLDSIEERFVMVVALPQDSDVNPAVSVPILDLYTGKDILYEYIEPVPPEGVATSPFRFSWLYINPPFYRTAPKNEAYALAVISDRPVESVPEGYEGKYLRYKSFDAPERLFRFRTAVTVFRAL